MISQFARARPDRHPRRRTDAVLHSPLSISHAELYQLPRFPRLFIPSSVASRASITLVTPTPPLYLTLLFATQPSCSPLLAVSLSLTVTCHALHRSHILTTDPFTFTHRFQLHRCHFLSYATRTPTLTHSHHTHYPLLFPTACAYRSVLLFSAASPFSFFTTAVLPPPFLHPPSPALLSPSRRILPLPCLSLPPDFTRPGPWACAHLFLSPQHLPSLCNSPPVRHASTRRPLAVSRPTR